MATRLHGGGDAFSFGEPQQGLGKPGLRQRLAARQGHPTTLVVKRPIAPDLGQDAAGWPPLADPTHPADRTQGGALAVLAHSASIAEHALLPVCVLPNAPPVRACL